MSELTCLKTTSGERIEQNPSEEYAVLVIRKKREAIINSCYTLRNSSITTVKERGRWAKCQRKYEGRDCKREEHAAIKKNQKENK